MDKPHQVVIVGGGFGGLYAAQHLGRAPVEVTLLDRRNFHLFQPLLYQVATGALSPANIAAPLRALLKRQRNTRVLLAEVTDIDVPGKRVLLSDGSLPYDTLLVAAGARHHYFGHDEWEPLAPGLKTVEDATDIRRRVLLAFEMGEREPDPARRQALVTFVIVGGGPTGVELAGAVAELAHHTLRNNFRTLNPASARILLLEGVDRVLPPYPPDLSAKAAKALARLGVTVRTRTVVTEVQPEAVVVRCGEQTERVPSHTVLWAAGVQASPLGKALAAATGVGLDRAGRVLVGPDLTVPGHPEIFVIGDMAHFEQDGKPVPGVAPVAMQQAGYAARVIKARQRGEALPPPFRYRELGNMATIGPGAAVVDFGWLRYSGFLAWLTWLFVHLINLVEFENKMMVLMQWGWSFWTRNRSARLITGPLPLPLPGVLSSADGPANRAEAVAPR
jgi:NADH:ubiquinone reductase (H+-translocating)